MKISHEKVSVISAFQVPELKTENLGCMAYQVIKSSMMTVCVHAGDSRDTVLFFSVLPNRRNSES